MVVKVGVFWLIMWFFVEWDYILELLFVYISVGLFYEWCVGVIYQQLYVDCDDVIVEIVDLYYVMVDECDVVVVVGSDYIDVISFIEFLVNGWIVVNFGVLVLLMVWVKDCIFDQVVSVVEVCLVELDIQCVYIVVVVVNWCELFVILVVIDVLCRFILFSYVVFEELLLLVLIVVELMQVVNGVVVSGDVVLCECEVMGVLVVGMIVDYVLEWLIDGMVVIIFGDCLDVVLVVVSVYVVEGFLLLLCIVFNGGFQLYLVIVVLVFGL